MNAEEVKKHIYDTYGVEGDLPWIDDDSTVFRHKDNRKWFALIMDVPREKLGLSGTELLDVVNLKCDPILTGSLRREVGIFPAYHMNKANWITVALDGSVPDDTIRMLLDMSFETTAVKVRRRNYKSPPIQKSQN